MPVRWEIASVELVHVQVAWDSVPWTVEAVPLEPVLEAAPLLVEKVEPAWLVSALDM